MVMFSDDSYKPILKLAKLFEIEVFSEINIYKIFYYREHWI